MCLGNYSDEIVDKQMEMSLVLSLVALRCPFSVHQSPASTDSTCVCVGGEGCVTSAWMPLGAFSV